VRRFQNPRRVCASEKIHLGLSRSGPKPMATHTKRASKQGPTPEKQLCIHLSMWVTAKEALALLNFCPSALIAQDWNQHHPDLTVHREMEILARKGSGREVTPLIWWHHQSLGKAPDKPFPSHLLQNNRGVSTVTEICYKCSMNGNVCKHQKETYEKGLNW